MGNALAIKQEVTLLLFDELRNLGLDHMSVCHVGSLSQPQRPALLVGSRWSYHASNDRVKPKR